LKQPAFSPMPMEKQVAIIYAVTNGFLDDVPLNKVRAFETQFQAFMASSRADLLSAIATTKSLSPELEDGLKKAIGEFKRGMGL